MRRTTFKDLTGQRFERLTVVRRDSPEGARNVRWQCLCDCGEYTVVTTGNLLNGSVKSCGCLRREPQRVGRYPIEKLRRNLTGQRFGKLLVIGLANIKSAKARCYVYWECKCDCGTVLAVRSTSLTGGRAKSCGCARHKKEAERVSETVTIPTGLHTGQGDEGAQQVPSTQSA